MGMHCSCPSEVMAHFSRLNQQGMQPMTYIQQLSGQQQLAMQQRQMQTQPTESLDQIGLIPGWMAQQQEKVTAHTEQTQEIWLCTPST